jgi:hypothetical protein
MARFVCSLFSGITGAGFYPLRALIPLLAIALSLSACGSVPQSHERQPLHRSSWGLSPRPNVQQCLADLGRGKAAFTPVPDTYYGAGCATLGTVKLASIRGDQSQLGVSNLGPVACPLADSFAAWARFGVDRAARQILGSPLVRIETMGSYNCRSVAGSDRLSAHAHADAIDVSGFTLADGRRITVLGKWNAGTDQERAFLRVIHTSACKRFGTVLGPAYNAAHQNHLHLELSGQSYCR